MNKLLSFLKILDENILKVALLFFVFLIPLYPKLPLFGVGYTYIAIRLDDFLAAALALIFLTQLIRKKVTLNRSFLIPIFLFWAAVFASFAWSVYVAEVMPYRQVALLHALRRVEYMMVFFIAASAIKSRKDFFQLFYGLLLSASVAIAYAIGQKFFGFPAVQTMNPAFARGEILLLTPEARISGTFGGHYDLAAFIVFVVPLFFGAFFSKLKIDLKPVEKYIVFIVALLSIAYTAFNFRVTNEWIIIIGTTIPLLLYFCASTARREKSLLFLVAIAAINVLVFTSSRISFLAYLGSTPLLLLFLRKYKYALLVVLLTVGMFFTSRDLSNRFSKTFQVKQILVNDKTGEVFIPQIISSKELPAGSAYYGLGGKPITHETEKYKQRIINETTANPDLSQAEKDRLIATLSADIKPVSGLVADISFATRLQIEWPRAIEAFKSNPLLGRGPATITEATDNDYLRWLGEFGILGFGAFMFLLSALAWRIFTYARRVQEEIRPLFYGAVFGIGGLMINAGYIDVFEASKVAYIFWYVMGIYIGMISLKNDSKN